MCLHSHPPRGGVSRWRLREMVWSWGRSPHEGMGLVPLSQGLQRAPLSLPPCDTRKQPSQTPSLPEPWPRSLGSYEQCPLFISPAPICSVFVTTAPAARGATQVFPILASILVFLKSGTFRSNLGASGRFLWAQSTHSASPSLRSSFWERRQTLTGPVNLCVDRGTPGEHPRASPWGTEDRCWLLCLQRLRGHMGGSEPCSVLPPGVAWATTEAPH